MFCLYRQFENMYCVIPFGGSSRTMKLIYGEKKKKNQRSACFGRKVGVEIDEKGQEGTFWSDGDVLCIHRGLSHTGVCIFPNSVKGRL